MSDGHRLTPACWTSEHARRVPFCDTEARTYATQPLPADYPAGTVLKLPMPCACSEHTSRFTKIKAGTSVIVKWDLGICGLAHCVKGHVLCDAPLDIVADDAVVIDGVALDVIHIAVVAAVVVDAVVEVDVVVLAVGLTH